MLKKIASLYLCGVLALVMPVSVWAQAAGASKQSGVDDTGFRWIPWLSAGDQIWKTVVRIDPKLKDIIGTGEEVAVAIADLNYDGKNEIILHFWGQDGCGVDGCLYLVLTQDGHRKFGYIAKRFERRGRGVSIDGRYLSV